MLTQAQEIADEWVTGERLRHVLSKIEIDGKVADMAMTPVVIAAMVSGAVETIDDRPSAASNPLNSVDAQGLRS